jgi:hypothetical protein
MKIRMSGNSIRLRLSQSEVKAFLEKGEVNDQVRFGPTADAALTYCMKRSHAAEIAASFSNNCITVHVPSDLGDTWANSEQEIGMEHIARFASSENGSLRILVEKDFKCLADRPSEDEHDNFPNPNLSC